MSLIKQLLTFNLYPVVSFIHAQFWTMDYQIVPKTYNQHFIFVISLFIFSLLPNCFCIVNRELVLTPKQGLQLSGKRIFYEESFNKENNALRHNDTAAVAGTRPWERTLKHVTYLTLFTNAANGIITGNFSKVKEYNDFLASDYVRSPKPMDSRFGDIVTLAQGRLEALSNGSYRFIEGNCNYECARESNIVAMWHIQKIRHRDTSDRKYHYEMKFSISPMTAKSLTETVVRGGPNKRTVMEEQQNNMQTFIQKEDDYPHSFIKIVSDKDEDFLERRYDAARNFRHVSPHYQKQQVTPIPQSTFLRGVYDHPPALHPATMQLQHFNVPQQHSVDIHSHPQHNQHHQQLSLPERLNIGEFYKGNYIPKTTSKIELFPNLLNTFMGKPQHPLPPPTTFRPPSNHMKSPRPEIYTLPQQQTPDFTKFGEYQQPSLPQPHIQFSQRTPSPIPIVTHHYHHHYFMPNNSAITIEQAVQQSGEQNQATTAEYYSNEVKEITAPHGYVSNLYEEPHATTTTLNQYHFPQIQHQVRTQYHPNIERQNHKNRYYSNYQIQQILPPAPQKFVFPNNQIEQQRVVHITPTPPLRKPQYAQHIHKKLHYENRPFTSSLEYTTVHVPLLISYPAPINEENITDVPTPRNKPFVQSDPLGDTVHYSEPDPLYANVSEDKSDNANKYISNDEHQQHDESQQPQVEPPDHYSQLQKNQQQNVEETDNKKEHSESIEAQLPAPNEYKTEKAKTPANIKQDATHATQSSTSQTISIKTEAPDSLITTTKKPKIFAMRNKRISLKTGTTTSSTSTTKNPAANPPSSPKPIKVEIRNSSTTYKTRKNIVSTSTTETPLRTISRYRNSYARTSSTSTTSTEKPVLKWTPKHKSINAKIISTKNTTPTNESNEEEINEYDNDDNNESEHIKTNESKNLRNTKFSLLPTTPTDFVLITRSEKSNATTTSVSSTMATLSPSSSSSSSSSPPPQPPSQLLTQTIQAETEIYEVLTQKSVSKSVSLKVGNNGEEVPILIDDEENEVKTI